MANVVNPEPESITLNTELEIPTLEPVTEQEQPLPESTSNPEPPKAVEISALDADAPSEPVTPVGEETPVAEATVEAAPAAEVPTDVPAPDAQAEPVAEPPAPAKAATHAEHGLEHMDDF